MTHDHTTPEPSLPACNNGSEDGEDDGLNPFGNGPDPIRPRDHPAGDDGRGLLW